MKIINAIRGAINLREIYKNKNQWADGEIPQYCGRGKAGDVLCIKELSMLVPITITLRKGSIDKGGVSFD